MYKVVIRVNASDINELLANIPTLRAKLSEKYKCSGTTTSFICISGNDMLIKIIPTLLKSDKSMGGSESLVPALRPYFVIIIESQILSKLLEAWNLITETLKNLGLRYVLIE